SLHDALPIFIQIKVTIMTRYNIIDLLTMAYSYDLCWSLQHTHTHTHRNRRTDTHRNRRTHTHRHRRTHTHRHRDGRTHRHTHTDGHFFKLCILVYTGVFPIRYILHGTWRTT